MNAETLLPEGFQSGVMWPANVKFRLAINPKGVSKETLLVMVAAFFRVAETSASNSVYGRTNTRKM